jgi:GNAT superfamily N-acetyltransferase
MENITYHLATENDIALLTELRATFVEDLKGKQKEEDLAEVNRHFREYLEQALTDGSYISWYAKTGDDVVGVGGIVLRRQPGNLKNPSGKWGYVMNMYTHPEHRKQGIAGALINKLMDSAREAGYHSFELHATPAGAPVYEKEGYQLHAEPTYKKIDSI